MKKFLKTLAVFAAVAALGFGFASCSDDDDGSGGGSGSALVAFSRVNSDGEPYTISFYSDNTYTMHMYSKSTEKGIALTMDLDGEKGTYTGDPTKDGTVVGTSVSRVDEMQMFGLMMQALGSGSIQAKLKRENAQSVVQRSLMTKATNTHENNLFRVYFFSTQASLAWIFFRVYTNLKKL